MTKQSNQTSRLAGRFVELKTAKRKALVTFVTAGDPEPSVTVNLMHQLVQSGVDVLELGVPFSDPMADGPVIQRASERALAHNVSLADVMAMVKRFRQTDTQTPVILMGYLNPVEAMGYEVFAQRMEDADVDGALIVDMPPEESGTLLPLMKQYGRDLIYLLSPTTSLARARMVSEAASGFLYYVSVKGVTGSSQLDVSAVAEKLDAFRSLTELPMGVGFGVSTPDDAAAVGRIADAVIVGSALIQSMEAELDRSGLSEHYCERVCELIRSMRRAMDESDR